MADEAPFVNVVDDDALVLRSLGRLLRSAGFAVRTFPSPQEYLTQTPSGQPGCLVLDLSMPGLNGLDLIKQVLKRLPRLRIVVLSMQSADSYVVEALQCGAAGYVLKETGPSEIIHAIQAVVAGDRYLSPKLAQRVLDSSTGRKKIADPYDSLTPREREILHLIIEGHTSAQIAARLVLSPRTVELHRSRIMKKLDLHNQTDIFRYALERGILSTES